MDSNYLELENLPTEIIVKILGYVPFKDLSSVSEVSRTFHLLAADPLLWKMYDICHRKEPEKLISILNLNRFRKLETLHLYQGRTCSDVRMSSQQTCDLFESLENIELNLLTIQHFDLTSVGSSQLSKVLNNIKSVSFNHAVKISDEQVVKIIEDMPKHGNMKALQVEELDFSGVESKSLSRAINSLTNFNSYYCDFSPGQFEEIFEEMAVKTSLKDLSLFYKEDLEKISPTTISKAFNNLERLYVGQCRLSAEQMFGIFQEMSQKSKLTKINLVFKDSFPFLLSSIPSDVLSKSLNSLQEIVLPFFKLTNTQMKDILEGVAASSSNVKHLDLGANIVPDVSLDVLKKVMFKLEPNEFKFNLQGKILEIYEETILSLRQELMEKEVKQVALRVEQVKLKAQSKIVRSKIVNVLTENKQLKSFLMSSDSSKVKLVLARLAGRVQVKIVKRSKFSSSYRFSAKSRIVKKSNVFVKMKVLSNSHVCKL